MDLLQEIKFAISSIEPISEVFLFGSRARGDFSKDSDWDVLVILPDKLDYKLKLQILNKVLEIELSRGVNINLIIQRKGHWQNNGLLHESPFYHNVINEYKAV